MGWFHLIVPLATVLVLPAETQKHANMKNRCEGGRQRRTINAHEWSTFARGGESIVASPAEARRTPSDTYAVTMRTIISTKNRNYR
jgi:hypothetical protein